MYLNRFDNPTNLGNPSATPADVIDDTSKVAKESEAFITNVINNGKQNYLLLKTNNNDFYSWS